MTDHVSKEPEDVTTSKKCLRLQAQTFLLTWPQNETPKETALERLIQENWKVPLEWAVVASERHQDGSPHLHAVVRFQTRLRTTSTTAFDFVCGKHGNYQASRSAKASVEYVVKKGDYVSHNLQVEDYLSSTKKPKISGEIAKMISEGQSLEEVEKKDIGFYMMNKRKIEEYHSHVTKRNCLPSSKWIPYSMELISKTSTSTAQVMTWLNTNLYQDRPYGAKDLYLFGPTMLGKTTMINYLEKFCRTYHIPLYEDWYDLYTDEDYDLVVCDEFKGHKSVQFLNAFCQAATFPLKRRNTCPYQKKKHLPVLIVSNYSLEQCYHKLVENHPNALEPLKRRFVEIELNEPLNIQH